MSRDIQQSPRSDAPALLTGGAERSDAAAVFHAEQPERYSAAQLAALIRPDSPEKVRKALTRIARDELDRSDRSALPAGITRDGKAGYVFDVGYQFPKDARVGLGGKRVRDFVVVASEGTAGGRGDDLWSRLSPEASASIRAKGGRPAINQVVGLNHAERRIEEIRATGIASSLLGDAVKNDPEIRKIVAEYRLPGESLRSIREAIERTLKGELIETRGRKQLSKAERVAKISEAAWAYFCAIYLTTRQRSLSDCWLQTLGESKLKNWVWFGYAKAAGRHLNSLYSQSQIDNYRLGKKKWAELREPFMERDQAGQFRPNECWVIDHTKLDFRCEHDNKDVRLWLTAIVDAASGKILNFAVNVRANSDTTLELFRETAREFGLPDIVLLDNGRDNRERALSGGRPSWDRPYAESVFARAGVKVTWANPGRGQSKTVERVAFGVAHPDWAKMFPSYIGNRPENKPEGIDRKIKRGEVWLPTLADVREMLPLVADAHNNKVSQAEGRKNTTPNKAFQRNPIAKRTASDEILDAIFTKLRPGKVHANGVTFRGLTYGQDDVGFGVRFGGKEVLVGVKDEMESIDVWSTEGEFLATLYNRRLRGVKSSDFRELGRRRKETNKLIREAAPRRLEELKGKTGMLQQLAAKRRGIEEVAKQRKNVIVREETKRPLKLVDGKLDKVARGVQKKLAQQARYERRENPPAVDPEIQAMADAVVSGLRAEHIHEAERIAAEQDARDNLFFGSAATADVQGEADAQREANSTKRFWARANERALAEEKEREARDAEAIAKARAFRERLSRKGGVA